MNYIHLDTFTLTFRNELGKKWTGNLQVTTTFPAIYENKATSIPLLGVNKLWINHLQVFLVVIMS